jgi:hypothetical protein
MRREPDRRSRISPPAAAIVSSSDRKLTSPPVGTTHDAESADERSLEQADKLGWTILSMRNDWATVF